MSKKISNLEFINQCKTTHNNKYDYSLTNYINSKNKIDIICPKHGIFRQEAYSHKNGQGCPKCSNNFRSSTEDFIKKAKKIHYDKYDYSLVNYISSKKKIKIVCKEHGIFEQTPNNHLRNNNCPKCSNNIKLTIDDFIKKSIEVHDNKYDYSLVNYKDNKTKIKIICKEHGIFYQSPTNHIKGHGCSKCKNLYLSNNDEFIKKANKIHNNKYDYSFVEYKNAKSKVKIKCKHHNLIFDQTPNNHLKGEGCPICAGNIKSTTEKFIQESKKIHGEKYDYSLSNYINNLSPITITCKKHGDFKQLPIKHKNGCNCPYCAQESKGEKVIIKILNNLNIKYIRQMKFSQCKKSRLLPFDFYLPNFSMCIEFDGRQHFEPVSKFGGEKEFQKTKIRDEIKNKYCLDNNIKLLRIKYDQKINEILNETFFKI